MARRSKIKESDFEIMSRIDRAARDHAKVNKEIVLFSRKVWRYWRRIAPVGDATGARYVENFGGPLPKHWRQTDDKAGSYRAGIVNRKGKKVNSFTSRVIAATDYKSHWIEYGTGGDTPTPEFACRARTVARFAAERGVKVKTGAVNAGRSTGGTGFELDVA